VLGGELGPATRLVPLDGPAPGLAERFDPVSRHDVGSAVSMVDQPTETRSTVNTKVAPGWMPDPGGGDWP
jgi:hypothetical protein